MFGILRTTCSFISRSCRRRSFRPAFENFPFCVDVNMPCAPGKRVKKGYPLVDAAMRQLSQTGWMHNRVRMVVASFLIEHLLPWQRGAAWFWDTLVDADLANNAASWQWVAGCCADPAPFFRIFNPVLQGEKFDPEGDYVRAFCPELANLPASVHPQTVGGGNGSASTLRSDTRRDYAFPMVAHAAARTRALAASKGSRSRSD